MKNMYYNYGKLNNLEDTPGSGRGISQVSKASFVTLENRKNRKQFA